MKYLGGLRGGRRVGKGELCNFGGEERIGGGAGGWLWWYYLSYVDLELLRVGL